MPRRAKRDLTVEQQLARGPVDLPLLILTLLLLGVGLIMVLSASYATAYYDTKTSGPLAYAIARKKLFATYKALHAPAVTEAGAQEEREAPSKSSARIRVMDFKVAFFRVFLLSVL